MLLIKCNYFNGSIFYTFKNEVMPTLGATHLFPVGNMKIQFSSDQGLCSALDLAYHVLTTTSALLASATDAQSSVRLIAPSTGKAEPSRNNITHSKHIHSEYPAIKQ